MNNFKEYFLLTESRYINTNKITKILFDIEIPC